MTGPDHRVEDTTVVMASMTRKESAMVAPRRIYRAGTLRYTLRELVAVFFWMLLGDFCFQLSMVVFASVLPLKLKGLGASNSVIGLIVGSIPSAMNMIVLPVVSYRSDRHRGRLGRRIPYLLWPTPLIALFLAVVGFSDSLGRWLYHFLTASVHLSQATVLFWTIGLCVGLYQFFNSFVASVYYYLFNDVVPQELMGRFYGLFRVVSAGAAFIFNFCILGYAGVPAMQRWIFVGAGAMYLVAFGLMCWRVREGQYPPPPERKAQGTWLAGLPSWYGSGVDLGILEALCLHVCAATKSMTRPSDIFGRAIRQHNLITDPMTVGDGAMAVPEGLGLGVELDRAALDRYTKRRFTVNLI